MRRVWRIEELEALLGGIKKHGAGKWSNILKDPQFASSLAKYDKTLGEKWKHLGTYDDSKRSLWTAEEVEALIGGVEKYGAGKWDKILKDPQFASTLAKRSESAIRNKWNTLGGYDHSKSRGKEWTIEEMEAFLGGIKKYRVASPFGIKRHGPFNWIDILKDPRFAIALANRSSTDLKDKWCNSDRSCDRRDYTMHPTPSSSKKQREDKRSGSRSKMISQDSEESEVEEVSDSQDESDDHSPCTITRQRRGTWRNRVNQSGKWEVGL